MTIVKELNELAEKMTGINPRATTDAQAMDFIEQHYQGGQPSPTPTSKFDYIIPAGLYDDVQGVINNQDIIAVLDEIESNCIDENGNIIPLQIGVHIGNEEQNVTGENIISNVWYMDLNGPDKNLYLYFFSNVDYFQGCIIYRYNSQWKFGSFSIS